VRPDIPAPSALRHLSWHAGLIVLLAVFSTGCVSLRHTLKSHRREEQPAPSLGTVRVLEGVLRGGIADIPPEGLTLQEVVARHTRPGATLTPSQYGGDVPSGTGIDTSPTFRANLWYAIVITQDTARIIPISLVSFSPLGSMPMANGDTVYIESFHRIDGVALASSLPRVIVAEDGIDVNIPATVTSGSGVTSTTFIPPTGLPTPADCYTLVSRKYGQVAAAIYLPMGDNHFQFTEDDTVAFLRKATVHQAVQTRFARPTMAERRQCVEKVAADHPAVAAAARRIVALGRGLHRVVSP
jgi:hypothetical protein